MANLTETRVVEIAPGEWVAQFQGGLDGWTTFSEVFATRADAAAWLQVQIEYADTSEN